MSSRTEGIIYVVTNGTGAVLDSWWQSFDQAEARAAELNADASMTLAWTVVTVHEGSGVIE